MDWKKIKTNLWKNDELFLEIKKVNFSYEKPAHNVVIYDSSIKSLENSLGKVVVVKHLGKKSEALKFAREYMRNN